MDLNISLQSEADIYCYVETCEKLITNNSHMVFKPLLYKQEEEIQSGRVMKKKAYKIIQDIWMGKQILIV